MIIVIVIITVAFIQIVIVATPIVVMLKQKNACLQTTIEKLKVMLKIKNKYTKNNINEIALLLTLNIVLILSCNRFSLKVKIKRVENNIRRGLNRNLVKTNTATPARSKIINNLHRENKLISLIYKELID